MSEAPLPSRDPGTVPSEADPDKASQNIDAVLDFYTREGQKISLFQRILERSSLVIGKPLYLGGILLFVLTWVTTNLALRGLGRTPFDPAPFVWLQGLIGLGALVTATIVLSKRSEANPGRSRGGSRPTMLKAHREPFNLSGGSLHSGQAGTALRRILLLLKLTLLRLYHGPNAALTTPMADWSNPKNSSAGHMQRAKQTLASPDSVAPAPGRTWA